MSPPTTVAILFPRTTDPTLLDLGFGLAGAWGAALFALGTNVVIMDAPVPEKHPVAALFDARATPLLHDGPLPDQPDHVLQIELSRHEGRPTVRVRLDEAGTGRCLYDHSFHGRNVLVLRGVEHVLDGVARSLHLESVPVRWHELFAPATSPREALEHIERSGALALRNRRPPGSAARDMWH